MTHKKGDRVTFFNSKGTLKIGEVKEYKTQLIEDQYEDYYVVEVENGKQYFVDETHILNKI